MKLPLKVIEILNNILLTNFIEVSVVSFILRCLQYSLAELMCSGLFILYFLRVSYWQLFVVQLYSDVNSFTIFDIYLSKETSRKKYLRRKIIKFEMRMKKRKLN